MMNMFVKTAFVAGAMAAALGAAAQPATDYPTKPVRIIYPGAAGGGGDAFIRMLAEHLQKRLGQPFVVENNAAASGTVAISQVAQAKPDGYTITLGTMSSTTLAPSVFKNLPYDPIKSLTTLARVGTSPIIMVATKDFPANDLKEFIAYAKKSDKPIQYGTWGLGSTGHFCGEIVSQKTGIKLEHIPYKGSAPVMTDLLGGQIQVGWLDIGTGTAAVKTGKVKALAMCTRRTENFPGVATYKEQGVDFDQWTGWAMFAPAGVPKPVVDKLGAALKEILQEPDVKAKMLAWGITPDYVPGEEQAAINAKEIQVWKQIAAGLKLE
jgi:tripartite-type tricarboxylate transporter receptor subunit TctC